MQKKVFFQSRFWSTPPSLGLYSQTINPFPADDETRSFCGQCRSRSDSIEHAFPNKPLFLRVCSTSLLKALFGKGELARNEQFLLIPQRFLSFLRTFCHFHKLKLVVCKLFRLGRV